MLTVETWSVFRRDIDGARMMEGRSPEYIERWIAMERERHAAYEVKFDRMAEEVSAMEANSRRYVCDLLARLGGPHCMSGMPEFRATCDALARMGVTDANHIFIHDREYIAATHMPAKTKETAQ